MSFKPKTVLNIPDMHVKKGDSLLRLYSLKRWLIDRDIKLDAIVQNGDLWDMEAFCLHDQASPEWYDRHFWDEFETGLKALSLLNDIATKCGNSGCKLIMTEGNHEARYTKFMASDNRLRSSPFPKTVKSLIKFHMPTLKLNYYDFQTPVIINDVAFAHYFVSGLMNRAQGGERPAANLLRSQFQSSVSGHSHVYDFAERTRADGRKLHALVAGCFVDPKAEFKFAGAARKLWWNGIQLLHFTDPGEYDVEAVSLPRLSA